MDDVITINAGAVDLLGDLSVPSTARAVVVFAHGSGSSRLSSRNRFVASTLRGTGRFGTLLFDLLTPEEDLTYSNRFDIGLLAERLEAATDSLLRYPGLANTPVGYFGASTGAAAAIVAASHRSDVVRAVVSRGGRPDLAGDALRNLTVPTLLIVGGLDTQVIELNRQAAEQMVAAENHTEIVPGATHLFEEPGTLSQAADLALKWFERFLGT